jgi:hypothetical protein
MVVSIMLLHKFNDIFYKLNIYIIEKWLKNSAVYYMCNNLPGISVIFSSGFDFPMSLIQYFTKEEAKN